MHTSYQSTPSISNIFWCKYLAKKKPLKYFLATHYRLYSKHLCKVNENECETGGLQSSGYEECHLLKHIRWMQQAPLNQSMASHPKQPTKTQLWSWITLEEPNTQCVIKASQYLLKHLLGVRLGCRFLPPLNSRCTLWSTSSTGHCQLIQCHHGIWRGLPTCHAYNKKVALPNFLQL